MEKNYPVYGRISGPIVMIGFGSIGRGTLPLIQRHFEHDPERFVIIDPDNENQALAEKHGVRFIQAAVTQQNYKELLTPLLTEGEGQGFCVNLSVDTGSLDLMKLTRELGVLYIDTVVEPWLGFYFDSKIDNAGRTNYALRETVRSEKYNNPCGTTAVSCCGANPGMVSWLVKEALLNLARDLGIQTGVPESRDEWAKLMQKAGVKGIHIAERDTQRAKTPKPMNVFINTWSVEGFLSEGYQPAELGWGTHEKWMPENAHQQKGNGCRAAIWLEQPGGNTRVRTWCPTPGAQYGFLVTHNESPSRISSRSAPGSIRNTVRPAIMPTTPRMMPCSRCTNPSAPTSSRKSMSSSMKPTSSTVSMNSAFCFTAMTKTPIGSARACPLKKPAPSRRIRMPPAFR